MNNTLVTVDQTIGDGVSVFILNILTIDELRITRMTNSLREEFLRDPSPCRYLTRQGHQNSTTYTPIVGNERLDRL